MAPHKYSVEYTDHCVSCETKTVILCCDKCGDAVCGNKKCCARYPQYKKEDLILCIFCIRNIEQKFKLVKEPAPKTYPNIEQSY